MDTESKRTPKLMTPLWVISLFVSLTEIVTSIAVIKATDGVQIALTTFVIIFPLLVATAFFAVLWKKPYVFYPPGEFTGDVNVGDYVKAMQGQEELVRADIQAEVANVRASLDRETTYLQNRIQSLETLLETVATKAEDTYDALKTYRVQASKQITNEDTKRTDFERRSMFRIHVVTVTKNPPTRKETTLSNAIAKKLQEFGYRTSNGSLGSSFYLSKFKEKDEWCDLKIIHNNNQNIASEVKELLQEFGDVPVKILSDREAIRGSKEYNPNKGPDFLPSKETDLTIAYCLN